MHGGSAIALAGEAVAEAEIAARRGADEMSETFKAVGLHDALYLVPVALLLTMLALLQACRCFVGDARRMREGLVESAAADAAVVK